MSKLYSISQAAQQLGVAVSTLRRWEYEGKLIPQRTQGNQRRYSAEQLMGMGRKLPPQSERVTLAYARVSSADQKQDLERQKTVLEMYCAAQGWTFELISDLGSGMNYRKKGLQSLLEKLLNGKIERRLRHRDLSGPHRPAGAVPRIPTDSKCASILILCQYIIFSCICQAVLRKKLPGRAFF